MTRAAYVWAILRTPAVTDKRARSDVLLTRPTARLKRPTARLERPTVWLKRPTVWLKRPTVPGNRPTGVVKASDRVVKASDRVVKASDRVVKASDRVAEASDRAGKSSDRAENDPGNAKTTFLRQKNAKNWIGARNEVMRGFFCPAPSRFVGMRGMNYHLCEVAAKRTLRDIVCSTTVPFSLVILSSL